MACLGEDSALRSAQRRVLVAGSVRHGGVEQKEVDDAFVEPFVVA
jgi:hypothetical protein